MQPPATRHAPVLFSQPHTSAPSQCSTQGHRALRPAQLVWRGSPPILSPCGFSKSGDPQLGDGSSAHLPCTHIHITHSHTHHTMHSLIHTHSHPHAYTLSDFSNVSLFSSVHLAKGLSILLIFSLIFSIFLWPISFLFALICIMSFLW